MNIHYIKDNVVGQPYFFSENTMKFFNQKLSDFKVEKIEENIYEISAPIRDDKNKIIGKTVRYFNEIDNKLYMNLESVKEKQ